MNIEITTLIVTVVLALGGYLATYFNNLRLAQRTERLGRINRQLGELYGPLYALFQASNKAWIAFRGKYRPQGAYFGEAVAPNEEELNAWRLWMSTVFMPINVRAYELILSKSDLLIESEMPTCLLDLVAHVTAYQIVFKKWEINDYSEHTSLLEYPNYALLEYTRKSFEALKAEQIKLIGAQITQR